MTSPQDTLQGYFDELLVTQEHPKPSIEASVESSVPEVLPATPEPPVKPTEPKRVPKPQKLPQTAPEPLVQEPEEQHVAREKLAKLLSSTPPKPVQAAATLSVVPESKVETAVETPIAKAPSTPTPVKVGQPVKHDQVVVEEEANSEVELDLESVSDTDLSWAENGRPQWAQERFEVLLFEVAGLTLAVPLISLGQIQPLTDELTPLFGQADWFMGLLPTPSGKIRTINTAKFVMPERYQESFLEAARYVVSISGLPWGLAVDAVNQPITLQPDDVKWRSERGKRPWLAGTVKEHMCALLDVATMGQLLSKADKLGSKQDPLADNL